MVERGFLVVMVLTFVQVGDVVVLLSTPRMSLVVGHNLVIDGGFTINENAM